MRQLSISYQMMRSYLIQPDHLQWILQKGFVSQWMIVAKKAFHTRLSTRSMSVLLYTYGATELYNDYFNEWARKKVEIRGCKNRIKMIRSTMGVIISVDQFVNKLSKEQSSQYGTQKAYEGSQYHQTKDHWSVSWEKAIKRTKQLLQDRQDTWWIFAIFPS